MRQPATRLGWTSEEDSEELPEDELERLEDEVIDTASAAATIAELKREKIASVYG